MGTHITMQNSVRSLIPLLTFFFKYVADDRSELFKALLFIISHTIDKIFCVKVNCFFFYARFV